MSNVQNPTHSKSFAAHLYIYTMIALGAFLAAFTFDVFFIPSKLFDGGIIGIAMIASYVVGKSYFPIFLIALNLPFVFLAYKYIGKVFVIHMIVALGMLAGSVWVVQNYIPWKFSGESLEVVVIAGTLLGIGIGLIIRYGGCLDGTEILGIIINRRTGITVGQVVLFCNIFIFAAAGFVFQDWHPPLLSLITYIVVVKVMDAVIVGLDETKSVLIISSHSKKIADAIIHELQLGLTVIYGRGGYSGEQREILYVICERLQLADLKDLIHREDPAAFVAIENLHEVASGTLSHRPTAQNRIEKLMTNILKPR